eukprot:13942125-Alexandrium_andersonii.AAC.1
MRTRSGMVLHSMPHQRRKRARSFASLKSGASSAKMIPSMTAQSRLTGAGCWVRMQSSSMTSVENPLLSQPL